MVHLINTIGIVLPLVGGATTPLALNVIINALLNFNVIFTEVEGIGSNAPEGFEYIAGAEVVNAAT